MELDLEKRDGNHSYTVFMAVAEKVGHDRRGNEIYKRDLDGSEVVSIERQDVLRRRHGQLEPVSMIVREKKLDDDLSEIAKAYEQFLKGD